MVRKSDFNENPVVSLDLDLDFGLRLRVCQNQIKIKDHLGPAEAETGAELGNTMPLSYISKCSKFNSLAVIQFIIMSLLN